MAQKLGNVPVGTILHLKENGVYQDYLVVNQGLPSSMYDSSCNGTWLLRRNLYSKMTFGSNNDYENSEIAEYLNTDFVGIFESGIQGLIQQAKIPYRKGTGSGGTTETGSNGLSAKVFLLSIKEIDVGGSSGAWPNDGSPLSYFKGAAESKKIAYYNGEAQRWWLRTPNINGTTGLWYIIHDGSYSETNVNSSWYIRPSLIFPTNILVDDDNNILAATYPTPPSSITVPTSSIPTGSSIAVSWSAVSGAESYRLQRSVDGGAWETVYNGTQTSFSDTAGVWNSVKYQVATVKVGIVSGYTTSSNVTILPYVISRLTVPSQIMEGQNIPISWSAADGATTYILERKVNSGSWTQIYSGANLSYSDTPSGSWSTVQYRVKGGKGGQYGTYKTSASIPVISASALVISGTDGYLGTLTEDIAYTVSSDTGNPITVERYVNGQLVATVTVQSGFAYTIPVMDLPTGAGTVKIMASVNTSGGQVTATRTWK